MASVINLRLQFTENLRDSEAVAAAATRAVVAAVQRGEVRDAGGSALLSAPTVTHEVRERPQVALCDRDDCAWKHRGVTAEATREAAGRHCAESGHAIQIYDDHTMIDKLVPARDT